jgi:hypothetical protein
MKKGLLSCAIIIKKEKRKKKSSTAMVQAAMSLMWSYSSDFLYPRIWQHVYQRSGSEAVCQVKPDCPLKRTEKFNGSI